MASVRSAITCVPQTDARRGWTNDALVGREMMQQRRESSFVWAPLCRGRPIARRNRNLSTNMCEDLMDTP